MKILVSVTWVLASSGHFASFHLVLLAHHACLGQRLFSIDRVKLVHTAEFREESRFFGTYSRASCSHDCTLWQRFHLGSHLTVKDFRRPMSEEAHRFELIQDGTLFLLYDAWTESKVELEGSGWELAEDEDSSKMYVSDADGQSRWCTDLIELCIVMDPDTGLLTVVQDDGSTVSLDSLKKRHRQVSVPVQVPGTHVPHGVTAWVLELSSSGAYVFWSLTYLYNTFVKSDLPPNRWYHSWWPWWLKSVTALGLDSAVHLRKPVPVGTDETEVLRIFREASASTYALLMLLTRWSNASKSKAGQKVKKTQEDWLVLLKGVLSTFVGEATMQFSFYLDNAVSIRPGLPLAGANRLVIEMVAGALDLSPLVTCTEPLVQKSLTGIGMALEPCTQVPLLQFCLFLDKAGTKALWLWKQVLWYLGTMVESAVLTSLEGQPVSSSEVTDAASAETILLSQRQQLLARKRIRSKAMMRVKVSVHCSRLPRRLLQYFFALRRLVSESKTVHVAFDASRVGNVQRMLGVVSVKSTCGILPPQVSPEHKGIFSKNAREHF
eukprot:6489836-Amphidinium_carterae.2